MSQLAVADGDNSAAAAKQRKDSCGDLVREPKPSAGHCLCNPGSGGGHYHSGCALIEFFLEISESLKGQQKTDFLAWIQLIQDEILAAEFDLTNEVKFVKIAYSLKVFFATHADIEVILQYKEIVGWGLLKDIFSVAIDINAELIVDLIKLDGNGNCQLFEGLLNFTSGNSQQHAAVVILIEEIREILIDVNIEFDEQVTAIYVKFQAFFEAHVDWEFDFKSGCEIGSFGIFWQFIDVCQVYWQISTLDVVLGGDASECGIIKALEAASKNSSFNLLIKAQFSQLKTKLIIAFQSEVDISIRLEIFADICFEYLQNETFMIEFVNSCGISGWGSIIELIFCEAFCHNHGVKPRPPHHVTTISAPTPSGGEVGRCVSGGKQITVDLSTNTVTSVAQSGDEISIVIKGVPKACCDCDQATTATTDSGTEGTTWGIPHPPPPVSFRKK
jgi:hypothetical protein